MLKLPAVAALALVIGSAQAEEYHREMTQLLVYGNRIYADALMDLFDMTRDGFDGWHQTQLQSIDDLVEPLLNANDLLREMCANMVEAGLAPLLDDTRCHQLDEDKRWIEEKRAAAVARMKE